MANLKAADRAAEIAELLAVSERSVQAWTKDARKAERDTLKDKAWDLWLDCHTQAEIGAALDMPQQTVARWLLENAELRKWVEPPESRQHFDVWQFPTADKGDGQAAVAARPATPKGEGVTGRRSAGAGGVNGAKGSP